MNIAFCIKYLFPQASIGPDIDVSDVVVSDNVIIKWDVKDELGQPIPQPAVAELEAVWPEAERANAIKVKEEELYNAREAEINAGFTSNALGVTHQYGFNSIDEMRMNGQLNIINADPTLASVEWLTLDAGILTHTREQFIQVCKDAFAFRQQKTLRDYQLRDQAKACATVAEIKAITW